MAPDFSLFSSPDSNVETVDSILSQAMDQIALEQIAVLNTSHLSDVVLPTHLESRFRNLKSFPGADHLPRTAPERLGSQKEATPKSPDRSESAALEPPPTHYPPATVEPADNVLTEGHETSPPAKKEQRPQPRGGFVPSPTHSRDFSRDSPSPPRRRGCCFGFSPKSASRKKNPGFGSGAKGVDLGKDDDELLADLRAFSSKEQQRRMRRALKEEERASKEAERMVELLEQASARMDFAAIDEFLMSDDEKKL